MDYTVLGQSITKLKHSYTKNGFPNLPNIINNNRMNYLKILKMVPRIKKYSRLIYESMLSDIKTDILPKRLIYLVEETSDSEQSNKIYDLNIALKTIINRNIAIIFKFYTILCKKDKSFAGFTAESEMLEFFLSVLNENKEFIYEEFLKLISIPEYKNDIQIFKKTIMSEL